MASNSQHRCVFVGNIPYDATEEQLVQICEEVGPVVSFRLVLDRETGKPKGYGFCEYKDEETALSARRNLQGYEINGRQLRVDFAENDKGADRNREQGRGGPGLASKTDTQKPSSGPSIHANSSINQPLGLQLAETAASVMAGALGGVQTGILPGSQSRPEPGNDPLTQYLAKMSRNQLNEVLSEMKSLAKQNNALARQLLEAYPQLAKALFQAELMFGVVPPQMLQSPQIRQPSNLSAQAPILYNAQKPYVGQLPIPQFATTAGADQLLNLPQNPLIPQPSGFPQSSTVQLGFHPPPSAQTQFHLQGPPSGNSGGLVDPIRDFQATSAAPLTHSVGVANILLSAVPPIPRPPANGLNSHLLPPSTSATPATVLTHHPSAYPSTSFGHEAPLMGPGKSTSLGFNSSRTQHNSIPSNPTSSTERTSISNDGAELMDHPNKLFRLEDGSRVSPNRNIHADSSGPAQVLAAGLPSSVQVVSGEETQQPEVQTSQFPDEVQTALLQQVMSLTPEQLNVLPPEQREQVIQLQQMLAMKLIP